jgi:hypothetical protein
MSCLFDALYDGFDVHGLDRPQIQDFNIHPVLVFQLLGRGQ